MRAPLVRSPGAAGGFCGMCDGSIQSTRNFNVVCGVKSKRNEKKEN